MACVDVARRGQQAIERAIRVDAERVPREAVPDAPRGLHAHIRVGGHSGGVGGDPRAATAVAGALAVAVVAGARDLEGPSATEAIRIRRVAAIFLPRRQPIALCTHVTQVRRPVALVRQGASAPQVRAQGARIARRFGGRELAESALQLRRTDARHR